MSGCPERVESRQGLIFITSGETGGKRDRISIQLRKELNYIQPTSGLVASVMECSPNQIEGDEYLSGVAGIFSL